MTSFIINNEILFGCGSNSFGRLGFEDYQNRKKFEKIKDNITSISNNENYSAYIDTNGKLWMTNSEYFDLSVIDYKTSRNTFTKMSDINFTIVSCGLNHMAAIDELGSLWTVGYNHCGQLGLNDAEISRSKNLTIIGNKKFVQVSCGHHHTMAIDEDGYLWSCGDNSEGQLGLGDRKKRRAMETVSDQKFLFVSCSCDSSLVLDVNGDIWASGEFLCDDNDCYLNNKLVKLCCGSVSFLSVSCGSTCASAIDTNNNLWLNVCDGNFIHESHNEDTTYWFFPISNKKFIAASCYYSHILAIDENGHLFSWGENSKGQLGLNDFINRSIFTCVNIETDNHDNHHNSYTLMNSPAKLKGKNTKCAK